MDSVKHALPAQTVKIGRSKFENKAIVEMMSCAGEVNKERGNEP